MALAGSSRSDRRVCGSTLEPAGTVRGVRVLVLRHHEEDSAGLIGEAFERRGASLFTHLFPADGRLPLLEEYEQVVVLGSKWSIYDETIGSWLLDELAWLRSADEKGVPVLGICFGAQALTAAFGGRVERAREVEIGWTKLELVEPRSSSASPPGGMVVPEGPWFQFHGDRCVLPDTAVLHARNAIGPQVFSIGRNLGVQFHPEIDAGQLALWMDNGAREAIEAAGKDPAVLLEETAGEEELARRRAQALVDAHLLRLAALSPTRGVADERDAPYPKTGRVAEQPRAARSVVIVSSPRSTPGGRAGGAHLR